jgi:hypothetical protein
VPVVDSNAVSLSELRRAVTEAGGQIDLIEQSSGDGRTVSIHLSLPPDDIRSVGDAIDRLLGTTVQFPWVPARILQDRIRFVIHISPR